MSKDNAAQPPFDLFIKGRTAAGLAFAILQHPIFGHLCGYVRVPKGHPMYAMATRKLWEHGYATRIYRAVRQAYRHPAFTALNVHGGVTFAAHHTHYRMDRGLWIGFDCAHWGDNSPGMPSLLMCGGVFRTPEFVRAECESLAQQIKDYGHARPS